MPINYLTLSYPNFALGQIIDPEEVNQNNLEITERVNEVVDTFNANEADIAQAVADSSTAVTKADEAVSAANTAKTTAESAMTIATSAKDIAEGVEDSYNSKLPEINQAILDANSAVDNIGELIDGTIFDRVGGASELGSFVASEDGVATFSIPVEFYNYNYDLLELMYRGIQLEEGKNYTRSGRIITLLFEINTGEEVQYRVTKNILIDPTLSDGAFLKDKSVAKSKLTDELQGEINTLTSSVGEHLAKNATLTQYGHVQHGIITATVFAEDWEGDEAPYTNTVSTPSVLATDNPIVDVIDIDGSAQDAWGAIFRVVTSEGLIIFYALEKPDVDLQVQIKVVR